MVSTVLQRIALGRTVASAREAFNITQKTLALMAGVSDSTVGTLERGGDVKVSTAFAVLSVLPMNPWALTSWYESVLKQITPIP